MVSNLANIYKFLREFLFYFQCLLLFKLDDVIETISKYNKNCFSGWEATREGEERRSFSWRGGGKTILRRTRFFQIALRGRGRGNFTRGFCFTGWWETEE